VDSIDAPLGPGFEELGGFHQVQPEAVAGAA
jgi:hypothetical protein